MAYQRHHTWWLEGPANPGSGRGGFGPGLGQTCADGTAYVTNFGCDDGSQPTCPSGYTLSTASGQYGCTSNTGGVPLIGVTAPSASAFSLCPIGATCTIIPGVSNNYVYVAAALFGLLLVKGLK